MPGLLMPGLTFGADRASKEPAIHACPAFCTMMPYADVYITNGGYGGVMLGIENRLPFVVAGVHEDKNEINARIGYFQLGINLKTETPKPEQLKNAVKEVLTNEVYKKKIPGI